MEPFFNVLKYIFLFISLYVQVFFLYVFFEKNKSFIKINKNINKFDLNTVFPGVTIIVPAYNEAHNIRRTIDSLLELNYPKDKLFINIVNDGSTDNTLAVVNEYYSNNAQIKIFDKVNGGKYTANNLGIENSNTPFVGCLDADSTVHKDSLKELMHLFNSEKVMAVCPTIITENPKSFIQKAQSIEYQFSIFVKTVLAYVDAIHVTPGPFSIYRKTVFEQIGLFRHAHNTEDQEIALRMKKNHMKIEYAPYAFVYTIAPKDTSGLYRQRLRWTSGFISNLLDYKEMVFNKKFGNIGFITLPFGILAIIFGLAMFFYSLFNIFKNLYSKYITYFATNDFSSLFNIKLDAFYMPSGIGVFVGILLYVIIIYTLIVSHKMNTNKIRLPLNIVSFFIVYGLLSPFWAIQSMYNSLTNAHVSWTEERDKRGI